MNQKKFWIFMGVSALLHLFLLLIIFSEFFSNLNWKRTEIKPKRLVLNIISLPKLEPKPKAIPQPKISFAEGLLKTEKPDPNTPYEGSENTIVASEAPTNKKTHLPRQIANSPGLELIESPNSRETQSERSSPSPQNQTFKPQQRTFETNQKNQKNQKNQEEQKKQKPLPSESLKLRSGPLQLAEDKELQEEKKKQEQQNNQTQKNNYSPPPASFSTYSRKSNIDGGSNLGPISSIASRQTDLGSYISKMRNAIGSRWRTYVHRNMDLYGIGSVRMRIYVRSDGSITNIKVIDGSHRTQQVSVARRSIMEVSGQLPEFSESMKQQLGEGFTDEFSFTIYAGY